MTTLKSSINLRKIFGTILLCSVLGYFSLILSASWRRISETNIRNYLGDIPLSERYRTVNVSQTNNKRKGCRMSRLVQKSFSENYKRCGQIFHSFTGWKTKTEKFLISVGEFQTFLIFTTATHTGK